MKVFFLSLLVLFSVSAFASECEVSGELPKFNPKTPNSISTKYMEDLGINPTPFRRYCKCDSAVVQKNCIVRQKADLVREFGACEFSVGDHLDPVLKGLESVTCSPYNQFRNKVPKNKEIKAKHI